MALSSTVSLYYRGPDEDYSETKRQTLPLMLGRDEQELVFTLTAPAEPIAAIRIGFFDGELPVRYLKLYGLTITQSATDESNEKLLIDVHNSRELDEHATTKGLTPHSRILGELYVVEQRDPCIEVSLPSPAGGGHTRLTAKLVLEALFGDEYILARDLFLTRQETLEQELHSAMQSMRTLKQRNEELVAYQRSPEWTIFLWLYKLHERFTRLKRGGLHRVLQPAWWARRGSTAYERWRTAKGYQNQDNKRA